MCGWLPKRHYVFAKVSSLNVSLWDFYIYPVRVWLSKSSSKPQDLSHYSYHKLFKSPNCNSPTLNGSKYPNSLLVCQLKHQNLLCHVTKLWCDIWCDIFSYKLRLYSAYSVSVFLKTILSFNKMFPKRLSYNYDKVLGSKCFTCAQRKQKADWIINTDRNQIEWKDVSL